MVCAQLMVMLMNINSSAYTYIGRHTTGGERGTGDSFYDEGAHWVFWGSWSEELYTSHNWTALIIPTTES